MTEKKKTLDDWVNEAEEDEIIVVGKAVIIEDGSHEGTITNIIREDRKGYDYLDVFIRTLAKDEEEVSIKAGFPTNISEASQLGQLLKKAGLEIVPEQKLPLGYIKDSIIGRNISFTTYTEETEQGKFARIINSTIKFIN